jgi:hypothetical protein
MKRVARMRRTWVAVAVLALATGALAQQILQNPFEGRDTLWVPGAHDAAYQETLHRITDESAHNGQRSETIQLKAQPGSFIYYTCDVGRAPVTEDLIVNLWVRAKQPGIQLLCRVVLPRERDPQNPTDPLTVLVPVDTYTLVNRWQALTLREPVKRLRQEIGKLRAKLQRDVVSDGAYVDRLILNVYSGPGETKVWTDDLEIGPVFDVRPPTAAGAGAPGRPAATQQLSEVQLKGTKLLVGGQNFFLLGIRHTGTPLKVLREAGFNTVWLDETTPPGLIEQAVGLGFRIVPTLTSPDMPERGGRTPGVLTSREAFGRTVSAFLQSDGVLGWDLGGNLTCDQAPEVFRTAAAFRDLDPDAKRPVLADVADGLRSYAMSEFQDRLMLGTHRWPLLTALPLYGYKEWLAQRRRLVTPKTFCWTWIQTHLPDWFLNLAYDSGAGGKFDEPIGPQPEQIRLLSYIAAGCGYRGLGYWSDRFLADSHTGRDRLLELALLNQEFQMLEPLLVGAEDPEPEWIETTNPEVKAAVLRTDKAVLVLVVWLGLGGQLVPGQGSPYSLSLTVPLVPASSQCWEVLPGRLRSYKTERVLGGKKVFLKDFNLTTALVFTSDLGPNGLVVRFQEQQRRMRKAAAQWSNDLAEEELAKALRVQAELDKAGQKLPDGDDLAAKAKEWIDKCRNYRRNGEFSDAYTAAQVALQSVRLLMRAHWDQAIRGLDTPVASPYAVSFYTLPRHYQFVEEVRRLRPEANALPDGTFETPPSEMMKDWRLDVVPPLDAVEVTARRVTEAPHGGKQCLELKVTPKKPELAPQVLERTFVAIHSPAVRLPPGTPVKISAWVRINKPITGSPDGALLYDSAGGEPLAVRLVLPTTGGPVGLLPTWQQFTLYRKVPASGTIGVTMALTGLGTACFDDVSIEPLTLKGPAAAADTTQRGLP